MAQVKEGDSVTVLNLSTPAKPTLATVLDSEKFKIREACGIAISGNYIYVCVQFNPYSPVDQISVIEKINVS